jgi:sugar lactone lactonase YvrE
VSSAVNLLTDSHNLIGECPVYDADNDRLFWVDMYDPAIHRFDFGTGKRTTFHPGEMVAALALAPEGLLAAAQSGLWLLDPETCDKRRFLGDPEAQIPTNRFNDGKCDSRGRLWVDTIDLGFAGGAGALYRWDVERGFATMDTGLNVPNGMGWSPDNSTMYLADTADRTIYAYDYDEEPGALSNRRVFVRIPDAATGAPDGLAVDAAGNVWAALFDGWRISRFSPGGELTGEVVLPVPRPTSCAFGGKDGRALYVTSARIRVPDSIPEQAPNSGAVFTVSL